MAVTRATWLLDSGLSRQSLTYLAVGCAWWANHPPGPQGRGTGGTLDCKEFFLRPGPPAYHIRVNGSTHLTQYNTPNETQCSGSQQPDTVYDNSCQVTNGSLISSFISRVTNLIGGTGSGQSINYRGVQQEFFCPGYSSTSLRGWQTITGKLGPLSNTTVAVCKSGPDAVAGAQIYIQGTGVKTVTDYCPHCCLDLPHYDNYNTSQQCSGLYDLPPAITVRIY